ncbi:unnamed protein product [Adineta steineri]|uniref:GCS light chain n=1 Tax=Adineta steineri TaxID=433720 RepID=A0A814CQZ8_9BILA|nr:unnamed protein product [Adineta steineri]CAF4247632.1 unnamed protein product [Adineta steineri]
MASGSQNENQTNLEPVLEPLFPKCTEILVSTGNTLTLFQLIKKTNCSITEEVTEYMSMMLQAIRKDTDGKQFQEEKYVKLLPVHDESQPVSINGTTPGVSIHNEQITREDLKFSIKIFLRSLEPEILTNAIDTVLNELKENYLESVMISLPNYGAGATLNNFMPLWNIIEDYIDKQKILSAGVCDFMLPLLSELCDAAKHKPYANQINLGVCCSIPEELNKYVKENNIQLLTHSDPIDVINDSDFQQTLLKYCHDSDALNWKPVSIVRYSSVIAHRGIIKSKGFLIYAKRELPMP